MAPKPSSKVVELGRLQVSAPRHDLQLLASCSQALGCSQSALLTIMMRQHLPKLATILANSDWTPPDTLRRYGRPGWASYESEVVALLEAASHTDDLLGRSDAWGGL